jgi:hypothetical protein
MDPFVLGITASALCALLAAWICSELWGDYSWCGSPFQERLPDQWPRSRSVRSQYQDELIKAQNILKERYPFPYLRAESAEAKWTARTHGTLHVILFSAAGGCLLFRPWRRVPAEAQTSSAAPTTRPDL